MERCLRLLENSEELNQTMNSLFNINIETIADWFVNYTLKVFQYNKKSNALLIKTLKFVQKYPHLIGPKFQSAYHSRILKCETFLEFIPHIMHIINNPKLNLYFDQVFMELADHEQFLY